MKRDELISALQDLPADAEIVVTGAVDMDSRRRDYHGDAVLWPILLEPGYPLPDHYHLVRTERIDRAYKEAYILLHKGGGGPFA